jgi:putative cell wall-binding protein
VLYEVFDAHRQADGTWDAGSGAVWDLRSNALRPAGWTSADAAGLPILPGLVRYDEVAAGRIDHAIRVTVPDSNNQEIWPARHHAGDDDPSLPPMGLRLRLSADFDVSGFPHADQVILRALQTYGMIVADNGSPWFISGVPDERWDNDVLHTLQEVPGAAFEAVDSAGLMVDPDSGQAAGGPAPEPSEAPSGEEVRVTRAAGADRLATAVALSTSTFPAGASSAVVAAADRFPDALAAAPLAAVSGAPVLLSERDELSDVTGSEIERLGAASVYLMGGESALSREVERAVLALPGVDQVVRLEGSDRYATAAEAGRAAVERWQAGGDAAAGATAVIALGTDWPDALAAGPLAAHAHAPLYLISRDRVPAVTREALADLSPDEILVAGGPAAVPDAVLEELARDGSAVRRIGGTSRYDTAALLADEAVAAGAVAAQVVIATGRDFPDGLAAGPAAVARDGVLLLTDRDALPTAARDWLGAHDVAELRIAGGEAAISQAVVEALRPAAR